MVKRNTKKAGFSLIEVLFAMLFLSVIVFGVIKLQTSNLTLSNTKQLELKAHSYAAQALEIVDALGKASFESFTTPVYIKRIPAGYGMDDNTPEMLDGGLFERTIQFSPDGLKDAFLVTALVNWTDSAGAHSVSAKRVIFN